jgi:hypothetical protein
MTEMVERLAVRLFWKAEHLDPSDEGDVPESEWFGEAFPAELSERRRQFWRYLARDGIATLREPTEAMVKAGRAEIKPDHLPVDDGDASGAWRAMIDAALADIA